MKLHRAADIKGCRVRATDGTLGKVEDFLFDDQSWGVRYFVVDRHPWLPTGKAVISTEAIQTPDWRNARIPVSVEKTQVKQGPQIDVNQPVSREEEATLHSYFSWLPYWGPAGRRLNRPPMPAAAVRQGEASVEEERAREMKRERHVYRLGRMKGYRVQSDGQNVGFVRDYVLEEPGWEIRCIVAASGRFLAGKMFLLQPSCVDEIGWQDGTLKVRIDPDVIVRSPAYDPARPVDDQVEGALTRY